MAAQYNKFSKTEKNRCLLEKQHHVYDLVQMISKITIFHFFMIYKKKKPCLDWLYRLFLSLLVTPASILVM